MSPFPVQSTAPRWDQDTWDAPRPWAAPHRCLAGIQIVFDGARRLLWSSRGPAVWRPERIWPSVSEREQLLAQLEGGAPVLIVLESESDPVTVLPEELDRAPQPVREQALRLGGDAYAIPVTPLDWLPEPQRQRGHEFLRTARQMIESNPKLLLSSFITDPAQQPGERLRFALRAWSRTVADQDLAEFARHLFPGDEFRREGARWMRSTV